MTPTVAPSDDPQSRGEAWEQQVLLPASLDWSSSTFTVTSELPVTVDDSHKADVSGPDGPYIMLRLAGSETVTPTPTTTNGFHWKLAEDVVMGYAFLKRYVPLVST